MQLLLYQGSSGIMKISKDTNLWDVMDAFNWKWCIVTLKSGKKIKLYVVDVDYESFGYDIIIYNYTGSNSYGNYIAFSDIDEIELYNGGKEYGEK